MNYVQALPLYTNEDKDAFAYFQNYQDPLDKITGTPLTIVLPHTILGGDGADIAKAIERQTRLPGLTPADLPCLWIEDEQAHFLIPLPANHDQIVRLLRQLAQAARTASTLEELEQTMTQKDLVKITDVLSPVQAIRAAQRAHPAFKYAVVVLGLLAVVAVALKYGPSPAALVFGAIVLVVLMVLFLVFAQAAAATKAALALPAQVLVWSFLILTILSVLLLFTSAFLNQPLPLKTKIIEYLGLKTSPVDTIPPINTGTTGTTTSPPLPPTFTAAIYVVERNGKSATGHGAITLHLAEPKHIDINNGYGTAVLDAPLRGQLVTYELALPDYEQEDTNTELKLSDVSTIYVHHSSGRLAELLERAKTRAKTITNYLDGLNQVLTADSHGLFFGPINKARVTEAIDEWTRKQRMLATCTDNPTAPHAETTCTNALNHVGTAPLPPVPGRVFKFIVSGNNTGDVIDLRSSTPQYLTRGDGTYHHNLVIVVKGEFALVAGEGNCKGIIAPYVTFASNNDKFIITDTAAIKRITGTEPRPAQHWQNRPMADEFVITGWPADRPLTALIADAQGVLCGDNYPYLLLWEKTPFNADPFTAPAYIPPQH